MICISLPDGSQRQFDRPVTVHEVAETISTHLAAAALAGDVDGMCVDTTHLIERDAKLVVITDRDQRGLEIIRHSTAHLLAQAVKRLFPNVQVAIGPVIEDGFYYDFDCERSFTLEDLALIEKEMALIAEQNLSVTKQVLSRQAAIEFFNRQGENYKVEIVKDIPVDEALTLYQQGDFFDLCRGPHVPSTGKLKAFKLTKVAGAYWRGHSDNKMLQRIYGTAWATKKQLETYLYRIQEAEKRDHRKIAKTLGLFHLQEEAPGMVFWHPAGWSIYQAIEQYMRAKWQEYGYQEIHTPQIVDLTLWEKSGHWEKFNRDMFSLTADERDFAIKPMNCPCHVLVFNQGLKSYRDLPLRLAEFGCCHRNEPSGALQGLMRTRSFTQDDAHIFCAEEQIQSEVSIFIDFLKEVYRDFGFEDVAVGLAMRPDQRVGSDEVWDKAECALKQALETKGLSWHTLEGEGAFYGPKIEFILKDCMARSWTTGSVQLDFSMPMRLGAEYVAEDGTRKVPVMLHRAICGSLERFIGILIEHYAGNLPVWLMPVQVIAMNITDRQADYANKIAEKLRRMGLRVKVDLRNEKIGFKIREHSLQKVPYQLIIGDREVETGTIAVRKRDGTDLGHMSVEAFYTVIQADILNRS